MSLFDKPVTVTSHDKPGTEKVDGKGQVSRERIRRTAVWLGPVATRCSGDHIVAMLLLCSHDSPRLWFCPFCLSSAYFGTILSPATKFCFVILILGSIKVLNLILGVTNKFGISNNAHILIKHK